MKCDACCTRLPENAVTRTDGDGFTGCLPCFPVPSLPADGERFMRGPCYRKGATFTSSDDAEGRV